MAPAPAYALTRRSFLGKLLAVGAVVALGGVVEACASAGGPDRTEEAHGQTTEPP